MMMIYMFLYIYIYIYIYICYIKLDEVSNLKLPYQQHNTCLFLVITLLFLLKEKLKRENLMQTLKLKSSGREEKVQRAFAKALEMQEQSAAEAAALKSELARTERKRKEDIDALTEQVRQCGYVYSFTTVINVIVV